MKHLNLVTPGLTRGLAALARAEEEAGPRIKSGATIMGAARA